MKTIVFPSGESVRLGVVAGGVGEPLEAGAVEGVAHDVVAGGHRPRVALRVVDGRRAGGVGEVGRGVEDAPVAVVEVAAGHAALAARDPPALPGRDVDHVLLVAHHALGLVHPLVDDALAVRAPVALGVLAAEGELPEVPEVRLVGVDHGRAGELRPRGVARGGGRGRRAGGGRAGVLRKGRRRGERGGGPEGEREGGLPHAICCAR